MGSPRGTDKMGSWWAGTGRVRVKIVNNVHGHLRSHNLGKRIMRCSFLARRLVVCLERVTTATIKQIHIVTWATFRVAFARAFMGGT
jgi:hypothetical protein